jgi:hypothetical protein
MKSVGMFQKKPTQQQKNACMKFITEEYAKTERGKKEHNFKLAHKWPGKGYTEWDYITSTVSECKDLLYDPEYQTALDKARSKTTTQPPKTTTQPPKTTTQPPKTTTQPPKTTESSTKITPSFASTTSTRYPDIPITPQLSLSKDTVLIEPTSTPSVSSISDTIPTIPSIFNNFPTIQSMLHIPTIYPSTLSNSADTTTSSFNENSTSPLVQPLSTIGNTPFDNLVNISQTTSTAKSFTTTPAPRDALTTPSIRKYQSY